MQLSESTADIADRKAAAIREDAVRISNGIGYG